MYQIKIKMYEGDVHLDLGVYVEALSDEDYKNFNEKDFYESKRTNFVPNEVISEIQNNIDEFLEDCKTEEPGTFRYKMAYHGNVAFNENSMSILFISDQFTEDDYDGINSEQSCGYFSVDPVVKNNGKLYTACYHSPDKI